jgi:hypothetical protein
MQKTLRSTPVILLLTCGAAFCQENANPTPNSAAQGILGGVPEKLNDNLQRRLAEILNPQKAQTRDDVTANRIVAARIFAPRPLRTETVAPPAAAACSIPLLNVVPPGTPVPMPNMMPPNIMPNMAALPTVDNMKIVVPAPACPASLGQISAPSAMPRTAP